MGRNPSICIRTGPHTSPSTVSCVAVSNWILPILSNFPNRSRQVLGSTRNEDSVSTRASQRSLALGSAGFSILTEATILPIFVLLEGRGKYASCSNCWPSDQRNYGTLIAYYL